MATKTNTKKAQQRETAPPALIAWHITERGEKKFWTRIGACWEHEDGERFFPAPRPLPHRRRARRSPHAEGRRTARRRSGLKLQKGPVNPGPFPFAFSAPILRAVNRLPSFAILHLCKCAQQNNCNSGVPLRVASYSRPSGRSRNPFRFPPIWVTTADAGALSRLSDGLTADFFFRPLARRGVRL